MNKAQNQEVNKQKYDLLKQLELNAEGWHMGAISIHRLGGGVTKSPHSILNVCIGSVHTNACLAIPATERRSAHGKLSVDAYNVVAL